VTTIAVIPARFGSRRLPGKPLVPILGKPMLAWVVEAALAAERVDRVFVATDDERIAAAAREAGAEARLTRADHLTGTDRVAECVEGLAAEVVLNLQGDEPLLRPEAVDSLAAAFEDPGVQMATLAVRGVTELERRNPHVVKIVVDDHGDALYFSRAPIPYRHGVGGAPALAEGERDPHAWRHVGVYGFRRETLSRFVSEPRTGIEAVEDLEQLRALRLGWRVRIVETTSEAMCVDVPADVPVVAALLAAQAGTVGRGGPR
jgi:3-deoxy-manno-octulosonate cytidylyltransferase (CMP-KDO synthetase)